MDDLDRARALLETLQLTLATVQRVKPDAEVGGVVRAVLEEVFDALSDKELDAANTPWVRDQVLGSDNPMDAAAALELLGVISADSPIT